MISQLPGEVFSNLRENITKLINRHPNPISVHFPLKTSFPVATLEIRYGLGKISLSNDILTVKGQDITLSRTKVSGRQDVQFCWRLCKNFRRFTVYSPSSLTSETPDRRDQGYSPSRNPISPKPDKQPRTPRRAGWRHSIKSSLRKRKGMLLSRIRLFVTPWTIQSMEFSRPEYWCGQPFPSSGDLPNPEIEPRSPTLQADCLPAEPQGKPKNPGVGSLVLLQWIFPTQELNRGLLHCRWILYQLSYEGTFYGFWQTQDMCLLTVVIIMTYSI